MRAGSVEGGARARDAAWALVAGASLLWGCMETRRSLGQDCLKNDDCLSNICSQLVCAAPPPTTDTQAVAEAGTPNDAGSDTGTAEDAAEGSAADNDGSGE